MMIRWCWLMLLLIFIFYSGSLSDGASCNWLVSAPSTVDGILGGHVVLPCSFTITNGEATVYTVTWTTSRNTLVQIMSNEPPQTPSTNTWGDRASLTDQASLRLNSITQQDGGQYTCKIRLAITTGCTTDANNSSVRQTQTSLVVKVPPSPPRVSTSSNGAVNRDIVENTTANLYCENVGASVPVTYKWQRGSQVLSGSMESGKFKLTITNIKRDATTYTCTVTNPAGTNSNTFTFNVLYPPGTPQLTISSTSPQINTDVTLTCSVPLSQRGNPATYMYTWRKGNVELSTSVPPDHSNMFTMRVDNINDAADYTCEARNSAGAGSSPSRTRAISVVNVPVFIHTPNSPQTLTPLFNDSHFKVECIYSGNPSPPDDAVVWNKDGAGIADLTKYTATTVQVTQSFLYGIRIGKKSMITWNKNLVNFSCDSVAEYDGRYQCSVNSGTSGQDMSSEVTVRTKYPPKLHGLKTVAAELRDTKTIVCYVCAYPPPSSYTWYFGNETNSLGSGQNLTISDIQRNNFGIYICKVTNEVGEKKIGFELKPEGPPEPPVSMEATEITSRTITVKWVPGYDGGFPQSFVVRYKKVSEDGTAYQSLEDIPQGNRQELSVIVQNLNASTPYRISIQAKNTRPQLPNTSSRTESDFKTADLPSVELQSVVYNGEELTVVWELLKGNPTKYIIQYRAVDDKDFLDLVTDIPASQNNITVTISLKQSSYEFRIIAYESEVATVDTQQEPRLFNLGTDSSGSNGAMVGGIVGGLAAVIFIGALIAFFMLRRRKDNKGDQIELGAPANELVVDNDYMGSDGGASNPALEGGDVEDINPYAESLHPSATNGRLPIAAKPAVAAKPGKAVGAAGVEGLYAQPNKKKKQEKREKDEELTTLYAQPDKGKKKKKKAEAKPAYDEDENPYQNVENKNGPGENPYNNVESGGQVLEEQVQDTTDNSKNIGPDGTVYADLAFTTKPKGKNQKDEIIRTEEATEYATIDFKRKAPPT